MLCRDSLRAVLIFLLIYGLALAVFLSSDRNYRRREEHGSAQWGSPREISRKYANKAAPENKILTQTVAILSLIHIFLSHAYEYVVREDILMSMEELNLPDDQAIACLLYTSRCV